MSESAIETTRRAPPSAWQTTTLAHLLHNFGLDLEAEGDTRGATARIEEAMAVYRQQLTIRPVLGLRDLIDAMGDLTRLLTDDPARALAVRTEQIKLQTQHLQTPAARLDLCRLLLTLSAEAFAADQDGHAPLKRALGVLDGIPRDEDGWASVRIEAGLRQAMAYRDAHRLDEATEAAIEALDLTDHTSVWRGFAARLLGELHMQADRPALAVPHLRPLWPSPAPLPTPAPGA